MFLVLANANEDPTPNINVNTKIPMVPIKSSFHQNNTIGTCTKAQTVLTMILAFHSEPSALHIRLNIYPLKAISSETPVAKERTNSVKNGVGPISSRKLTPLYLIKLITTPVMVKKTPSASEE